jgi:hypothetical protein
VRGKVRGGVHAAGGEVVVVVVRQEHAAEEDGDDSAHVEGLGHHVAENAEEIGDAHLGHLVLDQEAEVLKEEGADDGWLRRGVPLRAPMPMEAKMLMKS